MVEAAAAHLVQALAPAQVIIVGLHVDGAGLADQLALVVREDHPQCLDDSLRNVVLDGENVLHVAVVAFRPQVGSVGHVDQLGRDAQLVAHLANAALQNCRHLELVADFAKVLVLTP